MSFIHLLIVFKVIRRSILIIFKAKDDLSLRGTAVRVEELLLLPKVQRLRARLQHPKGWITLVNTQTGRRGGVRL